MDDKITLQLQEGNLQEIFMDCLHYYLQEAP